MLSIGGTPIHPANLSSRTAQHRSSELHRQQYVYEIFEAAAPPTVNLRIALKNSLFPASFVPIITKWQHRYTWIAGICYIIAPIASCSILFVNAPLGRQLSVVSFILQVPLLVLGGLALRTDIIKLLVKTFEFWFFTTANTATNVVMALYFSDLRALYLIPIWFGVQYNICIDAAVRGFKLMIISLVIGTVYHCIALVMVAFQAIPDVRSFQVMDFGPQAQAADDFLLNTLVTVIYMLVRSVYRRGVMIYMSANAAPLSQDVRLVRCICYRRAVKLRPVTGIVILAEDVPLPPSTKRAPVQIAPVGRVFESGETMLCGRHLSNRRFPWWIRVLLHASGLIGLSLTGIVYFVLSLASEYSPSMTIAAAAAPAFSFPYCAICFALYHPGLLKHLCFSFDFVFIAGQLLFAHVSACYIFQWDVRTLIVLSSSVWIVLMTTVDAFTPIARQKIGFRLQFLIPVVLAAIGGHLMIAGQIASRNPTWGLHDYVIYEASAFGRKFQLHVMPAFFNRVWMITFWELRLLWRLMNAPVNGLVMTHGVVDLEISRRRRGASVIGPGPQRGEMNDRMSELSADGTTSAAST